MTHPRSRLRGASSPGRHRLLDAMLAHVATDVYTRRDGLWKNAVAVDLGLGAHPWTTVDWADTLDVPVVGVDVDRDRVTSALPFARPGLRFVQGGFELPVSPVRMVRALNVFRDYTPEQQIAGLATLGEHVLLGGFVVDGACDRKGRVSVARVWQVGDTLALRHILFGCEFHRGFAPLMLGANLARTTPEALELVNRWQAAWTSEVDPVASWNASVRELAQRGESVTAVGDGLLVWSLDPSPRSIPLAQGSSDSAHSAQ